MELKTTKKRIKTKFKLTDYNVDKMNKHRFLSMFVGFLIFLVIKSSFIYCHEEENLTSDDGGKF